MCSVFAFFLFTRIKTPYVAKNKTINKNNDKTMPKIISSIMSILHCHFIFILRSVQYQDIFYIYPFPKGLSHTLLIFLDLLY